MMYRNDQSRKEPDGKERGGLFPRVMAAVCLWILLWAGCCGAEESGIVLKLIPREEPGFTNALFHYVYFDAEVQGASKLRYILLNPSGEQVSFRTRKQVDRNEKAGRSAGVALRKGQTRAEGMNVLFPSGSTPGIWTIEVTASAEKMQPAVQTLQVEITEPAPLQLSRLAEVHALMDGMEDSDPRPVYPGRIRFVAQDPQDPLFVKDYWCSTAFDLRPTANRKCSRADFSMALSWLGVDCTPIRMSEIVRAGEIMDHTFDQVCRKLGNVTRVEGDLETLWADYEAGKGSPVLLHFRYDDGGMHAVLLAARDREDPQLFYAITSGTPADTLDWADGRERDPVIPILIEKGEEGQRIQSPLLDRYHRGVIDEIWQWKLTDEN